MIETLDYEKVPTGFAHCFNGTCQSAGTCLRHQAARFVPQTLRSLRIVNPLCLNGSGNCPEFVSDTPVRQAYGWTHMFDNLPHKQAMAIKDRLRAHYGKSYFYRLKRMETSFTPQDQHYVRSVFRLHGAEEEPVYDEYRYEYTWNKESSPSPAGTEPQFAPTEV